MPVGHTFGAEFGRRFAKVAMVAGSAPVALLGMWAAPSVASAQSSATTREEVLRLPPTLRAAVSDFGAARCPTTAVTATAEGESPATLSFGGLRLEGVTVMEPAALQADWSGLVGQPISREGLARLAARMECRYREEGFIFARAQITPEGEEGRYRLAMNEGRVQSLEVSAAGAGLAGLVLRAFDGVKEGQPLNASAVRRGLAMAADVGVTNIRPTVRRSRIDPDAIDLILVTEAPTNQVIAVAQNANSDPLGPWGGVVALQTIGLTPLYERSTIGIYLAEDGEKQRALQFSTEALLTKGGLKARIEAAYAEAAPGGFLAPLDIAGETTFLSAELAGPVVVRRGLIATWRVSLESVDQLTDLFGDTPLNKDSLRIGVVGARADGLGLGGVWNASIDLRKGIEGLGANSEGDAGLSRADGDPQAFTVRADVSANRPLTQRFSLRGAARGQWADQPLLAFEEFNFGALSGGRGFDPGAITGDRGVALGLEGAHRPIPLGEQFRLQPYAFVEGARAWGEGLGPSRVEGASAGVGMRLEWAQKLRLDVNFAEPIGTPRNVASGSFGSKIGVQISSAVDWTFQNGFGRKVK